MEPSSNETMDMGDGAVENKENLPCYASAAFTTTFCISNSSISTTPLAALDCANFRPIEALQKLQLFEGISTDPSPASKNATIPQELATFTIAQHRRRSKSLENPSAKKQSSWAAVYAWPKESLEQIAMGNDTSASSTAAPISSASSKSSSNSKEKATQRRIGELVARIKRIFAAQNLDPTSYAHHHDLLLNQAKVLYAESSIPNSIRQLAASKQLAVRSGLTIAHHVAVQRELTRLLLNFHPMWLGVAIDVVLGGSAEQSQRLISHAAASLWPSPLQHSDTSSNNKSNSKSKGRVQSSSSNNSKHDDSAVINTATSPFAQGVGQILEQKLYADFSILRGDRRLVMGTTKRLLTPAGVEEMHKHFAAKICQMLYLIEAIVKANNRDPKGCPLRRMFVVGSAYTSMHDILAELSRLVISGGILLPKVLSTGAGFDISYRQGFFETYEFSGAIPNSLNSGGKACERDFFASLSDGAVLARLVELGAASVEEKKLPSMPKHAFIGMDMAGRLRAPNGDRLRKLHNLRVVLAEAKKLGAHCCRSGGDLGDDGRAVGEIQAEDIVDAAGRAGSRQRILTLGFAERLASYVDDGPISQAGGEAKDRGLREKDPANGSRVHRAVSAHSGLPLSSSQQHQQRLQTAAFIQSFVKVGHQSATTTTTITTAPLPAAYDEQMNPCTRVGACPGRSESEEERLFAQIQQQAAIKIQCLVRQFLAYRYAQRLKTTRNDEEVWEIRRKQDEAAIKIQALVRRFLARCEYNRLRIGKGSAFCCAQNGSASDDDIVGCPEDYDEWMVVEKMEAKLEASQVAEAMAEQAAAGASGKKGTSPEQAAVKRMLYAKAKENAAVKIQAWIRKFLAVRYVKRLLQLRRAEEECRKKKHGAVVIIQACVRRFLARCYVERLRSERRQSLLKQLEKRRTELTKMTEVVAQSAAVHQHHLPNNSLHLPAVDEEALAFLRYARGKTNGVCARTQEIRIRFEQLASMLEQPNDVQKEQQQQQQPMDTNSSATKESGYSTVHHFAEQLTSPPAATHSKPSAASPNTEAQRHFAAAVAIQSWYRGLRHRRVMPVEHREKIRRSVLTVRQAPNVEDNPTDERAEPIAARIHRYIQALASQCLTERRLAAVRLNRLCKTAPLAVASLMRDVEALPRVVRCMDEMNRSEAHLFILRPLSELLHTLLCHAFKSKSSVPDRTVHPHLENMVKLTIKLIHNNYKDPAVVVWNARSLGLLKHGNVEGLARMLHEAKWDFYRREAQTHFSRLPVADSRRRVYEEELAKLK